MNGSIVLGIALLAAIALPAAAQHDSGTYLAVGVGPAYAKNETIGGIGGIGDIEAIIDFDLNYPIGFAAVGYAFEDRLRLELEGAFRYNELEILDLGSAGGEVQTGSSDQVLDRSLMANVLYDIDIGVPIRPFIGFGLGAARVAYDISNADTGEEIVDDHDSALAFQVIAGFAVPLTPGLEFASDYRYWRAPSIELHDATGADIDAEHAVHSVMLSLRYGINALATRRQPYATPAPSRSGSYIALATGPGFAQDANIEKSKTNFDAYDLGPVASLAVGRSFASGLRIELEGSYWENGADLIDYGPEIGEARAEGGVQSVNVMANAFYDFGAGRAVRPFAGMGAGYVRVDYDIDVGAVNFVDDGDSALALQIMLGLAVEVSPHVAVTADYRFWMAPWLDLQDPAGAELATYHGVHAFTLGLRYAFGIR